MRALSVVIVSLLATVVWADDEDAEVLVNFTGFGVADPARDSAVVASYYAARTIEARGGVSAPTTADLAVGTLPTTRRDHAAELRDEYRRKAAQKREIESATPAAPPKATPPKPTVLVNTLPEGLELSASGQLEASKAGGVEVLGQFSIRGPTVGVRLGRVMSRPFPQEFLVAETQRLTALAGGNVAVITFVQNVDEKQGFARAVTGFIVRAEHFDQTKTRPGHLPTEI